ncbi:MAG: hypothetical protein PHS92_01740 [Candidatus Gracilibacteria bacterium]|nr:hypothetical protein [Candidatus Gracilibacteria bacterium]
MTRKLLRNDTDANLLWESFFDGEKRMVYIDLSAQVRDEVGNLLNPYGDFKDFSKMNQLPLSMNEYSTVLSGKKNKTKAGINITVNGEIETIVPISIMNLLH